MGGQRYNPTALPPGNRPGTRCRGGRGSRGRLGRVRKISPPSDRSESRCRLRHPVLNRPIVSGTQHIFESPKISDARVCYICTFVISSIYQVAQGRFPTVLALQDKWRDLKAGMWQYEQKGTPLLANLMRGTDLVCPWNVNRSAPLCPGCGPDC